MTKYSEDKQKVVFRTAIYSHEWQEGAFFNT